MTFRGDRDEGAVAVYAAILVPALMVVLMFFVDASCRWNSWRDANAAAGAAARAAVEWSPAEFVDGRVEIQPDLARQRAARVLAATGYEGEVSVVGTNPPTVVVSVPVTVDYVFMGGLGDSVTGHGQATAASGVSAVGG